MESYRDKIAVVTGGGTGMGRGLARQLAAEGCSVAICDVHRDTMAETARLIAAESPGVKVTSHLCDVSVEEQVLRFRKEVAEQHGTDHLHLLFNNAGIGGGGSLVEDPREEWDKTFGVCWGGVYLCTRAFLDLLRAAPEARIVNTSSVNGFWATLGPGVSHTAYSAAKFAVKGFSEALITDLALTAPNVKVSVVMPGHIGTAIFRNTNRLLGRNDSLEMDADEVAQTRVHMERLGHDVQDLTDDEIRAATEERGRAFEEDAPLDGEQAATIILDAVRRGEWRILVGEDAIALDALVRHAPEQAYDASFFEALQGQGHLAAVTGGPDDE